MAQSVLLTLAVLVLGLLRWRGRRRADLRQSRRALGFAVCAVTLLILQAVLWFIFGFGEVIGGDVSGVIHLLPAVLTLAMAVLAFSLPLEGGLILLIVGAALAAYFSAGMFRSPAGPGETMVISPGALVAGVPLLVAGAFLLTAAWFLRRDAARPPAP
jgi:tellurite resistance protein TehA-like permease